MQNASPTGCAHPGRLSTSRRNEAAQLSDEQRDRLRGHPAPRRAAWAETVTIPGGARRIADDVFRYAQANNVTQIIIGKSTRSRWFEILHGSVVHDLVRRAAISAFM